MLFSFFRRCILLLLLPRAFLFCFERAHDGSLSLPEQADLFFEAALYSQAIPLYQQVFQSLPPDCACHVISFRLAQSHYLLGHYKEAIEVLKTIKASKSDQGAATLCQKARYLSALAYRNLGLYEPAIQELKADPISAENNPEWLFELGLNHFLCNQLKESKKYFQSISHILQEPPLYFLSRLYMVRIDLLQGNHSEAEEALNALASKIPSDDALQYELAYLHGEVLFQRGEYAKAAECFTQALPKNNRENCPWYGEALYHLGWTYLKMGDVPHQSPDDQRRCFQQATESFQTLLASSPEEKAYLALGQCYLTRARCLKEDDAYRQAEILLSKQEPFLSREAQAHALLLRAEAAASYDARDTLYRQLTQESNSETIFYAKGWYLRGLNDLEEGQSLLSNQKLKEAHQVLERAAVAFQKAFVLLKETKKLTAGLALKYQALAHELQNTRQGRLTALSILESLLNEHPDILQTMAQPDEIFYLYGNVASQLAQDKDGEGFADSAEQSLRYGIARFPNGSFAGLSLHLLGALQYKRERYEQAESTYLQLANSYPRSPYAGEAWFWAAHCADKLGHDPSESKQRHRNVFEQYPNSSFAPEAYFSYYTYREYLQGDRAAIKHLHGFAKYADSPFLIQAHYLTALDYKRDRKTAEGKWIRRRNLTAAIDAFQAAESVYDDLLERGLIPLESRQYYLQVRYRATLERALANLAIADESEGAKRQIYLEYAEEVFKQLVDDFENPQHLLASIPGDTYPQIREESSFWLAQTYIKEQNDEMAESIFSKMLDQYRKTKTTKGYFLSRVWYEQGMIAQRRKEHALALQCLKHAEEAAKGRVLSTDQKLDLWIQQSNCYRDLGQWDNAILILSKVINDDAISSLRLKAMYLRAEIYELQDRPELARKQLQTTAKKAGVWALKAKEKLEKDYGY
jgi:tetratricopeptide (TPR) repeat protein